MVLGIVWLICTIAVWVLYHKLFDVIYFDFAHGCLKEIVVCAVIGAILAATMAAYWYITIPIVIIISIIIYKKNH